MKWPWQLTTVTEWPPTAPSLLAGIEQIVADLATAGVAVSWGDAPGVRVADDLSIDIDATGASAEIEATRMRPLLADWVPDPSRDEVVSRTPGEIPSVRVVADPATVAGEPFSASLTARPLPVDWAVVSRDGLAGAFGTPESGAIDGDFRASITLESLARIASRVADPVMKKIVPFSSLSKLRIAISTIGPRMFDVTIKGSIKLGPVPLPGSVGFDVTVAPNGTVSVDPSTGTAKRLTQLVWPRIERRVTPVIPRIAAVRDALGLTDVAVDLSGGAVTVTGRLTGRPQAPAA
ncbi:hypothetical protein [Microbacterium indicum]|uniref:hypothetical protein n=1 Tax=Microbacterium indicum TaxID=358100 RepID=UPI0004915D23|nr:hypothetical protein [Microbacterium indicum]